MRYKLNTSIVFTTCAVWAVLLPAFVRADGDINEIVSADTSIGVSGKTESGELLPDEQGALSDEAVATVTADGDFLLPTYLLPGETATVERQTTVETKYEPVVIETPVSVGQEAIVRTTTTTTSRVLGQETDIDKTGAANGQPVKIGTGHQVKNDSSTKIQAKTEQAKKQSISLSEEEQPEFKSAGGRLLIPLAPVNAGEVAEPALPTRERIIVPNEYADQMFNGLKDGGRIPFKMPHEVRITFYPKASAFSGQTLKWVRAFAVAALQDPRLIVEIRSSCAEADLQDKRLALVKGVLQGVGLSTHQIVVNYTNRPVDTMLLRAVPRPEPTETVRMKKEAKLPKNMSRVKKW
ncbi:MAG: hypothetical protein IJV07_05060 [Alphaproteobacteria bacterium]|nr:hypothetical protein [Alphaproteobacteria bacterium]